MEEHVDPQEERTIASGPGPRDPGELAPLSPEDERIYAMAAHVTGLFAPLIGPILVMVINRQRSEFVDDQAREALNFFFNVMFWSVVSLIGSLVLIGICGFVIVGIAAFILPIMGGIEAYEGRPYRYPMIVRLLK